MLDHGTMVLAAPEGANAGPTIPRDARRSTYRGIPADAPFGPYAALTALFNALLGAFLWWANRSGRLPERVTPSDVALVGVATYKASRLLAKATSVLRAPCAVFKGMGSESEVNEEPRGQGLWLVIGELVT
jgi:hypothetical protein